MSLLSSSYFSPIVEVSMLLNAERAARSPGIVLPARPDARAERIAIISHEMRNSLGVVRNAARLLRMQNTAIGIESARVLIERHVGQMSRHIEDLLESARPNGHSGELRLSHLDLRVTVENCVEAIAPDMWRRGHHVEVTLPAEALWLHADGARLEQSISNLLINAAKYTPDGGDIAVIVERIGESASVRVRDSGIGIAPEQLPKVFGMYVQVDAVAPRAEGGHGIGLAVVRTLIESHGGSVSASSPGLGLGSEFTVLLPVLWARPDVLTAAPGMS